MTEAKAKPKTRAKATEKKTGAARGSAAKKSAASARRKNAAKKTAKKKTAARKKSSRSPILEVSPVTGRPVKRFRGEKAEIYRRLIEMRDQILDGITFLAGDTLNQSQREVSGDLSGYSLHMADAGTDNFDREFALTLATTERGTLYEIEEAIRRMESGEYGTCDMCHEKIPVARLKALPYARYCVRCQEEIERRTRLGLPPLPVQDDEEEGAEHPVEADESVVDD